MIFTVTHALQVKDFRNDHMCVSIGGSRIFQMEDANPNFAEDEDENVDPPLFSLFVFPKKGLF